MTKQSSATPNVNAEVQEIADKSEREVGPERDGDPQEYGAEIAELRREAVEFVDRHESRSWGCRGRSG